MSSSHNILGRTDNDFEGPWRRLGIILKYILKNYCMKLLIKFIWFNKETSGGFLDHYGSVKGGEFLNQQMDCNYFRALLKIYDTSKDRTADAFLGFNRRNY
jgi:hypothetical protein